MSYTLRGRIETRLTAAVLPFLFAAVASPVLHKWWPLELAGLMIGIGLTLDAALYHPLLPYQPGWVALPLGLFELGATMGAARLLEIHAPLYPALGFFAGAWLVLQVLAHAALPLLRLTWPEDGGELGRGGIALAAAAPVAIVVVVGIAWAVEPPTVRLAAGVHPGPLVLDHAQTITGEPGAVVRGGIVITADDVTVKNVTVRGGEYGIEVDGAESVELDHVVVEGAALDGVNVRRSQVEIRNCTIRSLPAAFTQGIDISFGNDLHPSLVEGCTVTGGQEGIVTHFAMVMVRDNHISGTELRAITMTEMSMGLIEDNEIDGALGVGIFCGDYSECEIEDNAVSDVEPDLDSGDLTRLGVAIQAHRGAQAQLRDNVVRTSPGGVAAFVDATIREKR
ncbi:MAG TPA: right-handed parallel beta-helix repeat-containing protein [Gaiellaceae bacterium]|nr:right-handed parallel beta-helix repeat-containing protein [Gaiellaceae bacterium]